jgi:hypothetical protein
MAENSSQIPHEVEEIRAQVKFRPAEAIRVALLKESAEFPFLAGWALARLLAWALFDQHESHRIPEEEREDRTAYRPFRPRYAYKAGQLYLWYHLDYFYRTYEISPYFRRMTVDEAVAALALYFETAHVKKEVTHRGKTFSSLHNDKSRRRDLLFVYHVMDFLVRATLSGRIGVCKMKIARFFVEKLEPMGEQLGASSILKTWDRYRATAPYIYAFYPKLYGTYSSEGAFAEAKKITEEDWISRVVQLATKSTLEECLGHAAFAADELAKTGTRDVRIKDFQQVPRLRPLLREFDADELLIIESYDDTRPIE